MSEKSDEEIAEMVQSGDIDAFAALINRYQEKMMRYAQKFLSSHEEEIKDVIQVIFIKAYKNIQSFDPKRKFSSWLYRIAHNELVNTLKKKRVVSLSLFNLDTFVPYFAAENKLKEEISRNQMWEMVNKSIEKLEPKYREPLILYYFQELSYKEISDVIRIPISTVGIRLRRARKKLKSIYKELESDHE